MPCYVCIQQLASFPGLPRFCSLVCIQYNTQKRKKQQKTGSHKKHVPKEIRKLFCKLVPKIKFMGSLLLKYIAHFLMCRKLVSGTCRKLASYKSAGKFPTKHNCGLSSGCFCCFTIRCAGTCFLHFVGNFPTLQYSM